MKTVKIDYNNEKILEVGIYPIKVKQYRKFKECEGNKNEPIINVTWYDAIRYCNWLSEKNGFPKYYDEEGNIIDKNGEGWRLPTSEEWEFLAKGGDDFKYAGSDNLDEIGWFRDNSNGKIHNCGLKKPNNFGLYDMSGNVWEWCFDIAFDSDRVARGGSWRFYDFYCEVSDWYSGYPGGGYGDLGFRVLRNVNEYYEKKEAEEENKIKRAKERGAKGYLVVCDTFEYDDYIVIIEQNENIDEVCSHYDGRNMQRIEEKIIWEEN